MMNARRVAIRTAMTVTALSAVLVFVLPGINLLARISAYLNDTPSIIIHNQRFEWVGPRTLQSTSDGTTWTRTCSLILTSRGALMADGGYVGLSARVMSGPLKGATFDPRYEVKDMTPEERGPSVIQYDIPTWIKDGDLDDMIAFNLIQRVPLDRPCTDGYTGRFEANVTIPKNSVWRAAHGMR